MDSLLTTILVSPIFKFCIDLDSLRVASLLLGIRNNMVISRWEFLYRKYRKVLSVMKRPSPTTIVA
jgi:hypothetical protein